LIIGGGPIGVEMAQAHARLGCDVTLVEAFRIMGRDDPALVEILKQNLIKAGITLIEGIGVTSLSQTIKSGRRTITASLANGKQLTASHLLMAVGRKPALDRSATCRRQDTP
jgi:pyruvate/2-oxoglutarate dehydrogenase complex dihydrolipoamide dehydrogenase (E3) component